jgi:hypothetical protein
MRISSTSSSLAPIVTMQRLLNLRLNTLRSRMKKLGVKRGSYEIS